MERGTGKTITGIAVTGVLDNPAGLQRSGGRVPPHKLFAEKVCTEYPYVQIKVQKSQIAFSNKHNFAFVWLPIRKMKNRPDSYIVVSFGLPYRVDSPRIIQATEPYPNRWTHHVIIKDQNEIDTEFMDWIKEAYDFAANK